MIQTHIKAAVTMMSVGTLVVAEIKKDTKQLRDFPTKTLNYRANFNSLPTVGLVVTPMPALLGVRSAEFHLRYNQLATACRP